MIPIVGIPRGLVLDRGLVRLGSGREVSQILRVSFVTTGTEEGTEEDVVEEEITAHGPEIQASLTVMIRGLIALRPDLVNFLLDRLRHWGRLAVRVVNLMLVPTTKATINSQTTVNINRLRK